MWKRRNDLHSVGSELRFIGCELCWIQEVLEMDSTPNSRLTVDSWK